MQLFYEPSAKNESFILNEEEARHALKVLRKKVGDKINVIDGNGHLFECKLIEGVIEKCVVKVEKTFFEPDNDYHIHIAIAPTKNLDRIEWFVEKAVEIGIDELSFIKCKNSERPQLKIERIEKKAISAMKQSLKYRIPKINVLKDFNSFISEKRNEEKFIAFVDSSNPLHLKHAAGLKSKYLVLIGPEGDFTSKELDMALTQNFKKVSLGRSRLRTETAGMVACHILNLING